MLSGSSDSMVGIDELSLELITAITSLEGIESDEDTAFQELLCLFEHGEQRIAQKEERAAVGHEELTERAAIILDEGSIRSNMGVRSTLFCYGTAPLAIEYFKPIKEDGDELVDNSWQDLPQLLDLPDPDSWPKTGPVSTLLARVVSMSPHEDLPYYAVKLRRQVDDESAARGKIEVECTQRLERIRQRCSAEAVLIEAAMKEAELEHHQYFLSTMTLVERDHYITRHLAADESHLRVQYLVEEDMVWARLHIEIVEEATRIKWYRRFVVKRREIRERALGDAMRMTDVFSRRDHAILRFQTWQRNARHKANQRDISNIINFMASTSRKTLVKRYARSWNRPIQLRKDAAELQEFSEDWAVAHLRLVISEEEERDRNGLAMGQEAARMQLAEHYFVELDAAKQVWQARLARELLITSENVHLLMRLSMWFKSWKRQGLDMKSAWILQNVNAIFQKATFDRWHRGTDVKKVRRGYGIREEKAAEMEKGNIFMVAQESAHRIAVEMTESKEINDLHRLAASAAWRDPRVAQIATLAVQKLRAARFARWIEFANDLELKRIRDFQMQCETSHSAIVSSEGEERETLRENYTQSTVKLRRSIACRGLESILAVSEKRLQCQAYLRLRRKAVSCKAARMCAQISSDSASVLQRRCYGILLNYAAAQRRLRALQKIRHSAETSLMSSVFEKLKPANARTRRICRAKKLLADAQSAAKRLHESAGLTHRRADTASITNPFLPPLRTRSGK